MMSEQRDILAYEKESKVILSSSRPDVKHIQIIKDGEEWCSCESYKYRKRCRHVKRNEFYYNTTEEGGDSLLEYSVKAKGQERDVLLHFMKHKGELFTPPQVHEAINDPGLLTSIRRAMTNLTKKGYLEKTGEKREGKYHRPNFCWRLKE